MVTHAYTPPDDLSPCSASIITTTELVTGQVHRASQEDESSGGLVKRRTISVEQRTRALDRDHDGEVDGGISTHVDDGSVVCGGGMELHQSKEL